MCMCMCVCMCVCVCVCVCVYVCVWLCFYAPIHLAISYLSHTNLHAHRFPGVNGWKSIHKLREKASTKWLKEEKKTLEHRIKQLEPG